MKLIATISLVILMTVAVAVRSGAQIVTDASVGGGYQSNVFSDSNSVGDKYASLGLDLKYYPADFAQFSASGSYSGFSTNRDLSNLAGEVALALIPTSDSSNLTFGMTGGMSYRTFGLLYEQYNQFAGAGGADLSYRLWSSAHILASLTYVNNSYTNSDYGSSHGPDLATGADLTVFGSNAVAVRFSYSQRTFDQPILTPDGIIDANSDSVGRADTYEITGGLLRFSRPIGERTGVNISLGYRQLHVNEGFTVMGYTVDYLSPWADLWEGASVSGKVKHVFANHVIADFSVGYSDRRFVDAVGVSDDGGTLYSWDDRHDEVTSVSADISRPFALPNGKSVTPTLSVGYRKNQSSAEVFNYDDLWGSISLKFSL